MAGDYRLYSFVIDSSSPCALIRLQRPCRPMPTSLGAEPVSLHLFSDLFDFHLGDTRRPDRGRFAQVYERGVHAFARMMHHVNYVLQNAHFFSEADPNISQAAYVDPGRLTAFYTAFGINFRYPFHNVLISICFALERFADPRYARPRFQNTTLDSLPMEVVDMIASLMDRGSVVRLAHSSKRYMAVCRPRVSKAARFVVRVDDESLRRFPRADRRIAVWLLELVASSCLRASASMHTFLADADRMSHLREAVFENEWEFLLRSEPGIELPPPGIRSGGLYPLLGDACMIMSRSRVEHVRFLDFLLSPSLFREIGSHRTLRGLTLHGCFSPDFLLRSTTAERRTWVMTGLTYLALGVGRQQHAAWMVVSLCPALCHLYVYAATSDVTVDFPWDGHYSLGVVHALHTLQIDDAEPCVAGLVEWLSEAGDVALDRGGLKRFKLRVKGSICLTDIVWLLHTLSTCHRGLQVLILDGIQHATSSLFHLIAHILPNLQSLRIARRGGEFSARYGFCAWEDPVYEYARALSSLVGLRHFEANFRWEPHTYSPASLDRLAHGAGDESHDDGICDSQHCDDCMADGSSLVLPFAACCPALETFAVNADVALFSCSIQRTEHDGYRILDVRDRAHAYANERWNPRHGSTWAWPYATFTS